MLLASTRTEEDQSEAHWGETGNQASPAARAKRDGERARNLCTLQLLQDVRPTVMK